MAALDRRERSKRRAADAAGEQQQHRSADPRHGEHGEPAAADEVHHEREADGPLGHARRHAVPPQVDRRGLASGRDECAEPDRRHEERHPRDHPREARGGRGIRALSVHRPIVPASPFWPPGRTQRQRFRATFCRTASCWRHPFCLTPHPVGGTFLLATPSCRAASVDDTFLSRGLCWRHLPVVAECGRQFPAMAPDAERHRRELAPTLRTSTNWARNSTHQPSQAEGVANECMAGCRKTNRQPWVPGACNPGTLVRVRPGHECRRPGAAWL